MTLRSRYLLALLVAAIAVGAALLLRGVDRTVQQRPVAAPAPTAPSGDHGYHSQAIEVMGTRIQLVVPARHQRRAAREVFEIFRLVDSRMSERNESSSLSAVNQAAGRGAVAVPPDLRAVVRRSIEIGRMTEGAFDITWAALWGLWDFKARPPRLPPAAEIARRVALVDYRAVEVDEAAGTVRLPRAGMKLGLGAIAKGFALDKAAARLRAVGVRSFMIVGGGQVTVGGKRGDRPWRVGIRDPRGPADDYFAKVELVDSGISTSGDYERFFVKDGVRYHHILDPRTGKPARSGLRSASVISADSTLADALSTALMVLGRDRGLALATRLHGVEAVLVDDRGELSTTPGIGSRLLVHRQPRESVAADQQP